MEKKMIASEHRNLIEHYLCKVFNTMGDGLYITDRNGKTIAVNAMYESLTGLEACELLNENVNDLVEQGVFDVILNPQIVETGKSATAVQSNQNGRRVVLSGHPIFDYDEDVDLVVTFVRDITLISQLREQVSTQRELINKYQYEFSDVEDNKQFIANSAAMEALLPKIRRIATTDATALLLGETGVGKDVLARKIHEWSLRNKEPFLKVDCTSIPENLIESELFGYAPGAFSGASNKGKLGLFEIADKGTLFLDEIGELPLVMQGKLLRVLQDGEIQRVGGTTVKKVDVRIVAATNRDLEEEVSCGNFRSDLYYRLRVAVLNIPPLRERTEDLMPLVTHFLTKFYTKYKRKVRFSMLAEDAVLNYRWPGNVRELENLIHSLVVTCEDGLIKHTDLPNAMLTVKGKVSPDTGFHLSLSDHEGKTLKEIMSEIEREVIMNALDTYGSIPKVADAFQVNRTTIFRKVQKFLKEKE